MAGRTIMGVFDDLIPGHAPPATTAGPFDDLIPGHPSYASSPGFVSTIKRTAGQMAETTGIATQDVFGFNPISRALRDWGSEVQERNPSGISSLRDIATNPLLAVKEGIGSTAAQMPATLASGAAGQLIGGALGSPLGPAGVAAGQFLGRWIGAVGPTFIQQYGGIRKEQMANRWRKHQELIALQEQQTP